MKKLLTLVLAMAVTMSLAACSGGNSSTSKPAASTPASSTPASSSGTASSFPERPIELVAAYGPGGGHDIMLRTALKIINEKNLAPGANMNVVNKDGGSGAVGMAYVNGHAGDDYYVMCVTSSFLTTPLSTDTGLTYEDFTPLVCFGLDPEVVVVRGDSGITSMSDLLSAPRTVGGTGTGSIDNIVVNKLKDTSGADLNYIPYQGDGELVTALLGSQVDAISTNVNSCGDYLSTGDFVALGIATGERNSQLPDIPTMKEQGYAIELGVFRGVAGPANMSEEAKAYYIDLFTRLSETDAWENDYLIPNGVQKNLLTGDDFKAYLDTLNTEYETSMREMGLI